MLESFPLLTVDQTKKLTNKSPTKSCSLDPLPTWLLKDAPVLQTLVVEVTTTINASLSSGTVPSCLKKALVTPLLKKAGLDHNHCKNFRPVSNLAFIGKLTEKVVASTTTDHMIRQGLFDVYQSCA